MVIRKKVVTVHVAVCSAGLPLSILIGLGSQRYNQEFIEVIDGIEIKIERGRPRTKPSEVVADAAYDDMKIREYLRRRNIRSNIGVNKRNMKKPHVGRPTRFEEVSYKKNRSCIERFNSWIKTRSRRNALRYERFKSCFRGLLNITYFLIFWMKLHAGGILK